MPVNSRTMVLLAILLAFIGLLAQDVRAQPDFSNPYKIVPSQCADFGYFGIDMLVSGNTIFAAASRDGPGAVYILTVQTNRTTTEESKLVPTDNVGESAFGESLALTGRTLIITAPLDADRTGAVYLAYLNADFTYAPVEQKLIASDATVSARFGSSVAAFGDRFVVAATEASGSSGKVYLFRLSADGRNATQEAMIVPDDSTTHAQFGSALALTDQYLIVGAFLEGPGYVYLFSWANSTTAVQLHKFTGNDTDTGDGFGVSLVFNADAQLLVVGAYGHRQPASDAGAVYIFLIVNQALVQTSKLTASDASINALFGYSVALYHETLVVGAYQAGANFAGAAYVFQVDNATGTAQQVTILAPGQDNDYAGFNVEVSESYTLVSVDDAQNDGCGAAYLYFPDGAPTSPTSASSTSSPSTATTEAPFDIGQPLKFAPSSCDNYTYFARAFLLSCDTVFVGSQEPNSFGATYIFTIQSDGTLTEESKLLPTANVGTGRFGSVLGLSGNTLIISAQGDNGFRGAVYLAYLNTDFTNATVEAKLTTSTDQGDSTRFGRALAASGRRLLVSVPLAASSSGKVYLFQLSVDGRNATEEAIIVPDDSAPASQFGSALAVSDEYLIVGAVQASYIYLFSWANDTAVVQLQKTRGSDTLSTDSFGYLLAYNVAEQLVAVSSPNHDAPVNNAGAVYIFLITNNELVQTAKLTASDASAGAGFGFALALRGSILVVGAPFASPGNVDDAGEAYVFEVTVANGTATEVAMLVPGQEYDYVGSAVGVSDTHIVIASEDYRGGSCGAGYLYTLPSSSTSTSSCGSSTTATTTVATTTVSSSPSTSTSSSTPAFCLTFDNGDFHGSSASSPYAGQPVTEGGWTNSTLTYLPSTNSDGTFYGYFTSVTNQNRFALLSTNNSATFQAGFDYELSFSVLRIATVSPSVLNVQLRGKVSKKAVVSKSVTSRTFADAGNGNTLQITVSGSVAEDSAMVGEEVVVLVSSIGTGGASFGISQIEVCASPVHLLL